MIEYEEIKKKYDSLSNINSSICLNYSTYIPKNIYNIFRENLNNNIFCGYTSYKYFQNIKNNYLEISSSISSLKYHIIYNNKHDRLIISNLIESYKTSIIINDIFKINKNFEIYILLSDNKRFLPHQHNEFIEAENINGGFTSKSSENIFITREEEFSKVIMHEILHHSYIDNDNWKTSDIDRLKKHFKIAHKNVIYPNEAVIELYATILKLYFISLRYGIPFQLLYENELNYTTMLYLKIMKKQEYMNEWYEYTNSYCYIIFKTILFKNYDMLIDNFHQNTGYITDYLISNKISFKSKPNIKFNNSLKIMLYSDY